MTNCKEWFIVVLALIGLVLFLVAMFMNYNLKLDARTVKLEKKNGKELKRIEKLEKKNGSEQKQIDELKAEVAKLKGGKND